MRQRSIARRKGCWRGLRHTVTPRRFWTRSFLPYTLAAVGSILIVDDEDDIRELTAEALVEHGYGVEVASDGKEALAKLRAMQNPCLILLDLMMPVMNGWEFREAQLSDASIASIPVVIFSGAGHLKEKLERLQAESALSKPFHVDVLLDLVKRYCSPPAS